MECTIIPALISIADQHTQPTQNNESMIKHFLDYESTNTNEVFLIKYTWYVHRKKFFRDNPPFKYWGYSQIGQFIQGSTSETKYQSWMVFL